MNDWKAPTGQDLFDELNRKKRVQWWKWIFIRHFCEKDHCFWNTKVLRLYD